MERAARLMGQPEEGIVRVPDCERLCRRYGNVLGAHDLVLVKASRFVGLDRFVEEVCR